MDEKETINQAGIIPGVEKSLFTPEAFDEEEEGTQEEENGAGQAGQEETPAGEQPAQPAGEQPAQPAQPNAAQVVEPEKMPAGQQPAQPGQQPVYYAGKFKTEEDLKNAFINLGGNPNRYPTIEKLEEAYEVRQMEFTRTRQEIATQERLRTGIDNRQNPPQSTGNPLDPEALLDKVEWDKVENGRDLGRELIKLMSQIAPKNEPNLPSETELVERIMPIMREREERVTELRDIENDIPRLRVVPGQDNPFRDAFAKHVMAEKQTGSFISLRSSMKNFLSWGKSIAEEADRQTGIQRENKVGAAPLSDRGAGLPSGGPVDEVDSIIGSYKARKGRLGEL